MLQGKNTTRKFYNYFRDKIAQPPKSHDKFSTFDYAANTDFKPYWNLIYKTTIEEKLRSFQFKVLHRILATNVFLKNIRIKTDPSCQHCGTEETLEHLFWECKESKAFWSDFQRFVKGKHFELPNLSCKDVILGILPKEHNTILNHLVLLAKYHIYSIRYSNLKPSMHIFQEFFTKRT